MSPRKSEIAALRQRVVPFSFSHRITGIKRGLRCRRNNNEFRPVNFKVQAL
jgi:hypothetical protein